MAPLSGKNEAAPAGIDLDTLLEELEEAADPGRPIQLIFFGYGKLPPSLRWR